MGVGQAIVVRAVGGDSWDLMSIVYYDVVVAAPMIGAVLIVGHLGSRRRSWAPALSRPAVVVCVAATALAPLGWYATHHAPFDLRLEQERVVLTDERAGAGPVRVGVISDIQTIEVTDHERRAVRLVMEQDPDLVLVPGDVFQGTAGQFTANREALRELFRSMQASGGVFVVPGDTDGPDELHQVLEGTPAVLLDDEVVEVTIGDRRLQVGGVGLLPSPAGFDVLEALDMAPREDVRILLGHRPGWVYQVPSGGGVDLVVAGHTHGGQIQVPGLGAIVTNSDVPRSVAAGGLHEIGGTSIYVSSGVGHEQQGAPQVRLFAPPSVAILDLE